MKKRLCFLANHYKTVFFHHVVTAMARQTDVDAYWIVTSRRWHDYLRSHYPSEKTLYLPFSLANNDCRVVADLKVNELVYGDRNLRYNPHKGKMYLEAIQSPVYEFLKENRITAVFGETTWAHELLIHRIINRCPGLESRYYCPQTIRIPTGRFAFFTDEYQTEVAQRATCDDVLFDDAMFAVQKPDYFKRNEAAIRKSMTFRERCKRLKRLMTRENMDPENPVIMSRSIRRFLIPISDELNKALYRFVKTVSLDYLRAKTFLLVTLHKQPETSIDVLGRYYENQEANIVNLWRVLPCEWYLVVKEHTNAIGDRPLSFYRRLSCLDRLVFADAQIDSHSLIDTCEAVATVTGTIAYEAALKGKKAIVFSDVFFKLSGVRRITLEDLKEMRNLQEFLSAIQIDTDYDTRVKAYIYRNSWNGLISDPISDPRCIETKNLQNVARAVIALLET